MAPCTCVGDWQFVHPSTADFAGFLEFLGRNRLNCDEVAAERSTRYCAKPSTLPVVNYIFFTKLHIQQVSLAQPANIHARYVRAGSSICEPWAV